ncbi:alkaline phosphatase-like protein [Colletotrichum falcatum]|nr:alkaline phosphatase-like protein [Colletotrichum falcatum]
MSVIQHDKVVVGGGLLSSCTVSAAGNAQMLLVGSDHLNPLYDIIGGFPIFVKNGHDENYMPIWLQDAGYNTFYTGKMFNAHTIWNCDSPHLSDQNSSPNQDRPVNHPGDYSTDLVVKKAHGFLDDAVQAGKPFFLGIAPGPDDDVPVSDGKFRISIPLAAKRHEHLSKDATHRLQPGKECGCEEDVSVPLIVRGPGVPKGGIAEAVTAHVDLAPAILSLAGAPLRADAGVRFLSPTRISVSLRLPALAADVTIIGHPPKKVLDSSPDSTRSLFVLKSCKVCTTPLHPRFDDFYARQKRVRFSHCELGHIVEAKEPQFEHDDGAVYWKGL